MNKSIIKKLKKFLNKKPTNKMKLAAKLGYKTPLTIDRWLERGVIPDRQINSVNRIIEGK